MFNDDFYKIVITNLVAFCQRQGVLSADSKVYEEVANIAELDVEDIKELLD